MWANNMTSRANLASKRLAPVFFKNSLNNTVYRGIPAAAFAKYDRNKPHLNVGTIGKSFDSKI